ncbi:MAG: hypothetical protein IJZ67_07790 [Alistipes sp.]|nr:hypothetical protein [Alistipes sp.]
MKKITMLFVAAAALLGVTSCNTAAIDEVTLGQTTVTASFADSRTALDGVKTLWSAEDKIEVNGVEFTLTQGAGEATATFASNTPLAAAELYTAKYPAGVSAIPTTQKAVAGSFDPQAALAEASGVSADNLLFEHRHALLKLALAAPASKVEVLGYTLEGALEAEKVYYIAVAAENYEGLTAKVDGVEVRSSYNTVALENGQILNLGTLPNAAAEAVGIRTAADLVAFAEEVAAQIAAEQTPDGGKFKDANGVVNILANIDMKGVDWTPISNFAGTLEGNNHTIDNLVVENATNVAMFKNLSDATIQNLVFGKGCSFTAPGTSKSYAGAVVGQILTGATLKNIKTYATVTGGNWMGGICGAADKKAGDILFENCENYGSVTYPNIAIAGDVKVAGICSHNEKGVVYRNCVNYGNITNCANDPEKTNYNNVGGIVAHCSDGQLYNCSNTGTVKLDVRLSANIWLGGIVGRTIRVSAEKCSNSGAVYVTEESVFNELHVAGCFGRYDGDEDVNFVNCSNMADISISCTKNTGKIYFGGVCGYLTAYGCYFDNCTNSGNLSIMSKISNSYIGGIVGYSNVSGTKAKRPSCILNCTNSGDIEALAGSAQWLHIAGIVGKTSNALVSIDGCTNEGDVINYTSVTASAAGIVNECSCDVKGCTNTGNIIVEENHTGANNTNDLSATAGVVARLMKTTTISNCKNYGVVIYKGKGFKEANANKATVGQGGICGLLNDGTIDNCENYGTILSNDSETYINAKGSIAGWGGKSAAVTIKNCKVGGAVGGYVEADEDFGAAKATAITADNYTGYIYGGNAGKGVTVTDCAFAQSK